MEREWLNFGHKFADRSGNGPNSDEVNERCPVFLQWLDLVHQIHKQYPCSFEFSIAYLVSPCSLLSPYLFITYVIGFSYRLNWPNTHCHVYLARSYAIR